MRAAKDCIYENRRIPVESALALRENEIREFFCIECGEQVRPHKAGANSKAHFEHLERSKSCSYSAGSLSGRTLSKSDTYGIEDPRAIEGYRHDQTILTGTRNQALAQKRKELDDYTCLSCGFRLCVDGRYIIECHHLNPVFAGKRETAIQDLVSLCPTCHRIAHTCDEPLSVEEIRRVRSAVGWVEQRETHLIGA